MPSHHSRYASDERKRSVPACIPRTRLQQGDLVAEIVEDRRDPHIFECVVQRHGCSEILFLGQFHSQLQAEAAVELFFADFLGRRRPPIDNISGNGDIEISVDHAIAN